MLRWAPFFVRGPVLRGYRDGQFDPLSDVRARHSSYRSGSGQRPPVRLNKPEGHQDVHSAKPYERPSSPNSATEISRLRDELRIITCCA
jgi:hypothetical protein